MRSEVERLIAQNENIPAEPGDYQNPEDGLLYCGKCHTKKQVRVELFGKSHTVHCMCACEAEQHRLEEEERKRLERIQQIQRMKAAGLQDPALRSYTFANDKGDNPATEIGMKLYGVMLHFSHAFSNILPSFHPVDLLIGFTGAALFRAVVYFKGKNKKKYRQGMEYGSARWGTAEDIKPYTRSFLIVTLSWRLILKSI